VGVESVEVVALGELLVSHSINSFLLWGVCLP
jgi:hypothetical protein